MQNKSKKNVRHRKPETTDLTEGSNGNVKESDNQQKEMERREREKIVLWRSPVTTVHYFFLEAICLFNELCKK